MDQSKREQKLERLMALRDNAESMLDASRDIIQELLRARIVELDGWIESIKTEIKSNHQKMDACLGETKALPETTEACPVKTHACLEEEEKPAPEEKEVVAKPQEVPEGATEQETIGATEDRPRNLRLAVGCRGRLKTRTKPDGRLRQECTAAVGWPTRRSVPAIRKGGLRKGPGKKCRSGIRVPGRTLGSRMEGRNLKQRRPKYNVVRGTAKGRACEERRRTRLECNNGIRGRGARQHRRQKRKKTHSEAIRQKLDVKIAKFIFESHFRLREPSDGILWKCRPPPKRKR
jgi:hypothetical protein